MKKLIKHKTQTGVVDIAFVTEIRRLITAARNTVVKNVNCILEK